MKKLENKEENIKKLYLSGKSAVEISKLYNVSTTPVYNILKKYNIIRNMSKSHRKYNINDNYFDFIDNHHKSYILGLLMADGSNNIDKNTITLSLIEDDINTIKYVKEQIEYDAPIKFVEPKKITHKRQAKITIHSKNISKSLNDLGMIKNKTHFCKFPKIHDLYKSSFICGYFDGDGSFYINEYKNKYQISMTGNSDIIKTISELLNNKTYIYNRNKKTQNIKTLTISGKYRCFEFLNLIYSNNNHKMKRKYDKFLKLKKIIDTEIDFKLKKENIKLDILENNKIIKEELESNVLELYETGKSIRDINKLLKIDRRKISKILKNNNINIKSREFYINKQIENHKNYYKI
jgi:DNA-binding CsgD family transcriptional regulator